MSMLNLIEYKLASWNFSGEHALSYRCTEVIYGLAVYHSSTPICSRTVYPFQPADLPAERQRLRTAAETSEIGCASLPLR